MIMGGIGGHPCGPLAAFLLPGGNDTMAKSLETQGSNKEHLAASKTSIS
jgi:hypothetical protein